MSGLRLRGGPLGETLLGGPGNDTILGGGGPDQLFGFGGADRFIFATLLQFLAPGRLIEGGAGSDWIVLRGAGSLDDGGFAGVSGMEGLRFAGAGVSSVTLGAQAALAFPGGVRITAAAPATALEVDARGLGAGTPINVSGTGGADRILGGAGNDTILGGGGADSLAGGEGDDVFAFTAAAFLAPGRSVDGGAGTDTLLLTGAVTLADAAFAGVTGVEILRFTGPSAAVELGAAAAAAFGPRITVTLAAHTTLALDGAALGAATALRATGQGGDDLILGGAGNDSLAGFAGDDTLIGGLGVDTLRGGEGNDTLGVTLGPPGAGRDLVLGGLGFDTLLLGLTAAQLADPSVRGELVRLQSFLDAIAPGAEGGRFLSSALQLHLEGVEAAFVELGGTRLTIPDALALGAAPSIAFAEADVGATPENGGLLLFTLTRAGDLSGASTVDLRLSGTADAADLFGIVGATQQADPALWRVSFAPGQASATVEVLIAPDSLPEPDETVTFTIEGLTGAVLSATGPLAATGLILNDDVPPALAFRSLDAGSSAEGTAGFAPQGRLAFTLERSGDLAFATAVVFELGGSASLSDIASVTGINGGSVTPVPLFPGRFVLTFDPGAASAEIELFLTPDTEVEANETVTLTLLSATDGVLPPAGERTATGLILDDDAVSVGFAAADAGSVNEGGPGPDGRLAFTLARTGSLALDTVVRFVVQGDVAPDEIYLLGATLIGAGPPGSAGLYEAIIAAGATEQVIEVFALGDRIPEADETVTLDLVEVVANGALSGITTASGVFLNDDVLPVIAFRSLDVGTTLEGTTGLSPQGVLFFVLERSGDLSYPTIVTLELGGSAAPGDIAFLAATNGGSLAPVPGEPGRYTLAFDAGAASADIEVFIAPDALEEAPETVTLTLVSAFDGVLPDLSQRTATGTILDDDAPNRPPVATGDAFAVQEGRTLVVGAAGGLLLNDADPDGDPIQAVLFDPVSVAGGTVTMVTDGSFTYTPPAGFSGVDSFTYVISDGLVNSAPATVTITVLEGTPVANPDAFTVHWRSALNVAAPGLLANDSDPNGDPIEAALFDPVSAQGGTVTMVTDGSFTYTPPAGFVGLDSFTYVISDGVLNSLPATVTVTVTNTAPVAAADAYTVPEGQTLVVSAANGLLLNDTDPDGDPIQAVLFDPASVAGGTVTMAMDGSFTYTPPAGFSGVDSFTYVISDGVAASAAATVTITVLEGTPVPALFRITQTGELARPEGNPLTPIGFVFEVTRTGTDLPAATLTYALGPGPGTSADAADLVSGFGTFTIAFAAGQTSSGIISIPVTADLVPEPDETFTLSLVSATAGTVDATPIVFTILDDDAAPPPPAPLFYFSGTSPGAGRELWLYDARQPPPARVATMIEAAQWLPGPDSSNPREIAPLSGTVFFRVDEDGAPMWLAWDGASLTPLASVGAGAFDAGLAPGERNLGVVSGERFWFSVPGDFLIAFDADVNAAAAVPLAGSDRRLLTDAGGSPAYAGVQLGWSVESGSSELAEQLFVLHDVPGAGWQTVETFVVDTRNAIREIAGLQPVADPLAGGQARTVFFAGDYRSVWTGGTFHADALWRVDLQFDWMATTSYAPRLVDLNGSAGAVPLAPRALTVVPVSDGLGGERETLFLFGQDDLGSGRLFAYRFDPATSAEWINSTDLAGVPLRGLEIAPWTNGVLFSARGEDGMGGLEAVVATWTDADGDGAFDLSILFSDPGGIIEHLTVDGAGNAAWVLDSGGFDSLYKLVGGTVGLVVTRAGEIDEVRMASGHLVFRADSLANPGQPTLFDHDYAAFTPFTMEIPTDELTPGVGITSFSNAYRNVAIPGALVFEAYLDDPVYGPRLFVTDGTTVHFPAGGFAAASEGAVLNGAWVGTGYRTDLALNGLFSIAADGTVTTLHASTWNMAFEAEVLDEHVLFGTRFAPTDRILLYDSASGMTDVLLDGYELGSAEVVGSRIIFSARDETRPVNADADPTNDVWELWSWSLADGALFLVDLPGSSATNPVMEWWRHQDFLGDDSRVFWKQNAPLTGIEVWMIDLAAPVPGANLYARDVAPYDAHGANHEDAVFANGRLYWQASTDGTADTLRLWTTTNIFDAVPVTGPQLWGGSAPSDTGYQLPYRPVVLNGEVFFLARINGADRWGIFQVNDDGVTASLITPDSFGSVYGLAAVGAELIFFARDPVSNTDQMWQIVPESSPVVATPFRYTAFAPLNGAGSMDDIFLGGDANHYFGRFEPDLGRELWVLDTSDPRGARVVIDLNQDADGGLIPLAAYAPEQVVPVQPPLWV